MSICVHAWRVDGRGHGDTFWSKFVFSGRKGEIITRDFLKRCQGIEIDNI